MTADEYLYGILRREAVDVGPSSPIRGCQAILMPTLNAWANGYLLGVTPSGSFAKGTANRSGTDIDLFISLSDRTTESLKTIYDSLFTAVQRAGFAPRKQNVSIGLRVGAHDVDLVPAKRQDATSLDHSLYRNRADTWTKTNVARHVQTVSASGVVNEIRILKLWRNQRGLDFPSFYLELTVIQALAGRRTASLSANVRTVLEYLRDRFANARVEDPANTNNILSDELSSTAKQTIATAAKVSLEAPTWGGIVT